MKLETLFWLIFFVALIILGQMLGSAFIHDWLPLGSDNQIGRFSSQTVADYVPAKGCK